jgi:hypothetical protein
MARSGMIYDEIRLAAWAEDERDGQLRGAA